MGINQSKAAARGVYGYARVSTDKQEFSIPAQIAKINDVARLRGCELTEILIDDGESAKSLQRPAVTKLLGLVDSGRAEAVIIPKLDRLTRSIADLADLLKRFERRKVALVSAAESIDTSTATGEMMANVIVVMSQWERKIIGERTKDVMRSMKANHLQTGNVPYGYQRGPQVGCRRDGTAVYSIIPHDHEQSIIRTMMEHRNWNGKPNSFTKIADALNKRGLTTRSMGQWKKEYVRSVLISGPKEK